MPKKKSNQKNQLSTSYAKYSGIAFQMFAIIAVGAFIGVKLDEYFNQESNLYTIIFSLLSVLIAMYYVIKQILDMSEDDA